ncbi:MAG: hypothetical protein Q9163_005421 [Psora crenata]
MTTIQNWYKSYCGRGGDPGANNGQQPTTLTATSTSTTGPTGTPTIGATVTNQQGAAQSEDDKPWFSTHWKWVVMLIVLAIGLSAIAVAGWFLHRRYHRRRESQWSSTPSSHPNINTWGPGQSVHDLGYGAAVSDNEKGKTRDQITVVQQPGEVHKSNKVRSAKFGERLS